MTASRRLYGLGIAGTIILAACGGGGGNTPAGPPPPNPLYVRSSGADTHSGADKDNALRSIGKAASLARSGYTIIVGPGTYPGGVTNTAAVGVAPQELQFIADATGAMTGDPAGAVVVSAAASGAVDGFNLSNSPGSLIDGFTITGFPDAGIVLKSASNNFVVQNCIVTNNPGDGIRVQDSSNVLVFNNLVYGNGGVGVGIVGQISGSPSARVLSNTLANNGNRGLVVGNTKAASAGALVQNNIVQNNSGDANIKVLTSPRSDLNYSGDYNLVSPATYLPKTISGTHDLNTDALFTADYHLQRSSPAIDAGAPLTVPTAQITILRTRTTDGINLDTGDLDLGFHFLK
jgi:parallel beta-helix repeat protein